MTQGTVDGHKLKGQEGLTPTIKLKETNAEYNEKTNKGKKNFKKKAKHVSCHKT